MTGLDRERLARVLGMLGSAHDGEIAAAGRMAHAMIRGARITWAEVLNPALPIREPLSRTERLELCLGYEDMLTDWEAQFVAGIRRQRRPWSPKQAGVIAKIAGKILQEIGGGR
jgi:hypothetical protein